MTKSQKTTVLFAVIIIVALAVIGSGVFTVSETDQYVITRFGKPVRTITEAGLNFKIPFIEEGIQLEKRILEWDGHPNQIPTLDKKYIIVDTTARWRIIDPRKFVESVRTERGAQSRLDDIIDSATREAISSHNLVETVRNSNTIIEMRAQAKEDQTMEGEERLALEKITVGRDKIQRSIFKHATPTIKRYGIVLIDVRIKRLNYEQSVQTKVFDRMISERKRIAEKLRSEGLGKKAEIEGRMDLELNKIQSEAYRKAQEIKGRADAKATAIYANAYNRDAEFFEFTRTLEAYRASLDDKFTLFLSSEGEFLELLNR